MFEKLKERFYKTEGVKVYCGDTDQNLRQCAILEKGQVFYDKAKLPERAHRETYTTREDINHSWMRAVVKARELGHNPLIMEGRLAPSAPYVKEWDQFLKRHQSYDIILPEGVRLPLTKIWLPEDGVDWQTCDLTDPSLDPQTFLSAIDPVQYLSP